MSKALEYTKDIVVARVSDTKIPLSKDGGKAVAEFFEEIFNKINELEDKLYELD